MEDVQKEIKLPCIVPRTIVAACSQRNKGALDWYVYYFVAQMLFCHIFYLFLQESIRVVSVWC